MRSISKGVAFLCFLLTVWSAITLFTHRHSDQTAASTCQMCVAAHSSAPTKPSTPKPVIRKIFTVRRRPIAAKQRLIVLALWVRPPPSV